LARVRWANLGRSAALLAAGLIVVTRGCGGPGQAPARIPDGALPGDVAPAELPVTSPGARRQSPSAQKVAPLQIASRERRRARPVHRRRPRRHRPPAATQPSLPRGAPRPLWWPQHRAGPLPEFF
jgi:hypothetical protein